MRGGSGESFYVDVVVGCGVDAGVVDDCLAAKKKLPTASLTPPIRFHLLLVIVLRVCLSFVICPPYSFMPEKRDVLCFRNVNVKIIDMKHSPI